MNAHYYLYALTCGGCLSDPLGSGVDPRFPVEILACGQTTAIASRVGLDQFDVRKLECDNTDVNWLSQVALRHNQIISDVFRRQPLLPLRLGALFYSRLSLLAKMEQWESIVIDFLKSTGDGQEWAAKLYLDPRESEENLAASCPVSAVQASGAGVGRRYFTQVQNQRRKSRALKERLHEKTSEIETSLMNQADRYCRSHPLPASLTGRREKMLWNAAFLVPRSASERWSALVEEVRTAAAPEGLSLEVSGPWPPYHFCPTLES